MFTLQKCKLNFNEDDVPLTYKLNNHDYDKNFTLCIFENTTLVFSCRLYYLNKIKRETLNISKLHINYELADVFLYDIYRGKTVENIKYSKICLNLVDNYIKNINIKTKTKIKIKGIILWTTKDNIKAQKRYIDIGFKIEKNKHINNYYQNIAYERFNIDKQNVIVYIR